MTQHLHRWPTRRAGVLGLMLGTIVAVGLGGGCGTHQLETSPNNGGGTGGFRGDFDGGISCENAGATGGSIVTMFPPGFVTPASPIFDGVVKAADPPPPISGGTLLVLRGGTSAVVADPDRDRIYIVDLADLVLSRRASIDLAPHDQPGRLAQDSAGLVHVVLRGSGKLVTIDPVSATVVQTRPLCATPRGIAYEPAFDRLHVACADGNLLTFAPRGAAPERTLTLPTDLRDVVVDGSRLLVTRFRSAEMLVVDATGVMTETIRPVVFSNTLVHGGSPFGPAVAWRTAAMPDGGAVMVHQRGMDGTITPSHGGYGGLNPCDTIVHTSVTRMRSGKRPVAGPAMPGFVLPVDLAVSPDGQRLAMVAAGNGHATQGGARRLFITGVDDATLEYANGCGDDDKHGPSPSPGCPNGPGGDVCSAGFYLCNGGCIPSFQMCPGPPLADAGTTFLDGGGVGTGGTGGSSGSGGTRGAVDGGVGGADGGAADGAGAAGVTGGSSVPSDGGTGGTAGASDGPRRTGTGGSNGYRCNTELVTQGGGSAEPIAVAFVDDDRLLVQVREPAQLVILSDATGVSTTLTLSQESRADTGHTVFHSNSGGGLACASCHPEGHEDGRVWNFQCGQTRRTQDVGGGLKGTEPFHWSGDLPNFPSLVDNVFVARMSGPQLSRDQTSATLDWLNTIPEKPPLRPATDAPVLRGKAIFNRADVACFSCHAGAALTNNMTVNVGTSAPFQVPSLRGVGWRAPYLHDGCASTLEDRFSNTSCAGGDDHGHTSQLSQDEIADLVAYLQSI